MCWKRIQTTKLLHFAKCFFHLVVRGVYFADFGCLHLNNNLFKKDHIIATINRKINAQTIYTKKEKKEEFIKSIDWSKSLIEFETESQNSFLPRNSFSNTKYSIKSHQSVVLNRYLFSNEDTSQCMCATIGVVTLHSCDVFHCFSPLRRIHCVETKSLLWSCFDSLLASSV